MRERLCEEEEAESSEEEEGEGVGVVESLNILTRETAGTEEGAAEGLEAALEMTPEGMEEEEDRGERERTRGGGLKGHWEPSSFSLRNLSQAELRLLMPVMVSTR